MIHEGNGNYSSEHHGWNNLIPLRLGEKSIRDSWCYIYDDDGPTCLTFALQTRINFFFAVPKKLAENIFSCLAFKVAWSVDVLTNRNSWYYNFFLFMEIIKAMIVEWFLTTQFRIIKRIFFNFSASKMK